MVTAEVPLPSSTPFEVKVVAPVPPLPTGSTPDVICDAEIAIDVLFALVICPCALTAITGTCDALP